MSRRRLFAVPFAFLKADTNELEARRIFVLLSLLPSERRLQRKFEALLISKVLPSETRVPLISLCLLNGQLGVFSMSCLAQGGEKIGSRTTIVRDNFSLCLRLSVSLASSTLNQVAKLRMGCFSNCSIFALAECTHVFDALAASSRSRVRRSLRYFRRIPVFCWIGRRKRAFNTLVCH